jgi:hypothetical protein
VHQLGLRFARHDARKLRTLEAAVRNGELGGQAANVFAQAAAAAESGEPLILYCDSPVEAVEMAAAYIAYGITRPVIEQLSGASGPASRAA